MLYYVKDILTDRVRVIVEDFDMACRICDNHPDTWVTDETGKVLHMFALPF